MRRFLSRLLLLSLLFSPLGISAASAAVKDRITAAVSGSSRVTIPNSVHSKVRLAADLGPAAPDTRLTGMTLRFSLTDAQQATLDQLLLDQQNPSSPSYHQWLTPGQYAAQFGLSAADIAKISAWLTSQGFTVTAVANSGTFIRFDGTVAQAQTAFATSIHSLSLNGETHFANVTDAAVPSAFSAVVGDITGLHNFRLKPRIRTSQVSPQFTSSVTGDHYIAPGDFYTIYNETPLLNHSINGTGVTIAIMGQTDIIPTDISSFRAAANLSVNAPTVTLYGCDPGIYTNLTGANTTCDEGFPPTNDDLAESSLDLEWSGAVAPSANIIFVNSNDVFDVSLTDAIDNDIAPIMSISYGDCEAAWGTTELNTFNQLFKQANAMGISVVAPGGDNGAADCDDADVMAMQGLAVDFPASSPYVTGMGGTMFNEGSALGATSYWNSSTTSDIISSAISYIPEAVWNEDIAGETFSAGGGGVSNFFSKPAWQQGTGVPADASRDVPDLALNSAPSHDGYLYCVQGSCLVGFRESAGGGLTVAGGTSFATPTFAGVLALVEQKTGARIGNANPTIYALANNLAYYTPGATTATNGNVVFNDVTTGNNDDPCTASDPNCPNGGNIGFNAGVGYDAATGWGSINAYNLVTDWNLVTPLGVGPLGSNISSTTISATPSSVAAGATATLTAIVTGTVGTLPTGTIQFLLNNTVLGAPVTISTTSGVSNATYSYVSSCASLGQQVIAASYSGDTNYASSKGAGITPQGFTSAFSTVTPVEIQVTNGTCPTFTVTAPAPPTVTSGTPSVVVTVTPVNGFTGTVVFSASAVETSSILPSFSFSPSSVTITGTTPATSTLTLSNITAALHAPTSPGRFNPGPSLAQRTPSSSPRVPWYATGSGVTIASLLFLTLPRRRRRLGGLLLVALSIALLGSAIGCGSAKNGTIASSTNPDAGTYSVTVTGTYTSSTSVVTSQSTVVNFTVE